MYHLLDRAILPQDCRQLALLSTRLDIAPGPGGTRITDPEETATIYLPWLRDHEIVDPLSSHLRVSLIALYPSQQIVLHRDPSLISFTRYHIPIQVNDGCWSLHDGAWQRLVVGLRYQMDPTQWHGAVNWGAEIRLHLILDA